MKSKKWLISLGLAVVLVVAFALPGCPGNGEPQEYWHTPIIDDAGDVKVTFDIGVSGWYEDIGLMVVEQLQDFGLDVGLQKLDSGTYYDYLYWPPGGGMEAFIGAEDPSPDPWSDWIWSMLGDPLTWGEEWNPTWWNSTAFDQLFVDNYVTTDLEEKKEVLEDLQEILATEIPMIWLVRESMLNAARVDKWTGWYNMMGGFVTWINEYSIREVTNLTAQTRLNIGHGNLPENLNMDQGPLMYSNVGCLYLMLVYENLVGYPKMATEGISAYNFTPKLASDYEVTYEDGGDTQVWTFDLRDDVKWHDGVGFTAADVVYTCKYMVDPWSSNRPINWTAVDNDGGEVVLPEHWLVTNSSTYEVEMRYIEDYHQNEGFVPVLWLWYGIIPEHVFGPDGATNYPLNWVEDPSSWTGNYVGTGPYEVKEFVEDDYLLLERVDDYWGDGDDYWELPAAEEVLFQLYENPGTFWIAFDAGVMDSSASYSFEAVKKAGYEADVNVLVDVLADMSVNYMGFNLHEGGGYPLLQDLALRQAIAAAIDKQNIVDIVFGGWGETSDSWVYPESPMHHDTLPNNTYDLTEAASILTAAGYTKHLP